MTEVQLRKRPEVQIRQRPAEPKTGSLGIRQPPERWPNGSAYLRGPQSKQYKKYTASGYQPAEENPTLMGRVFRTDEGQQCWRYMKTGYTYMGTFNTWAEAFNKLKLVSGEIG